jgi:hypothetical protein
MTQGAGLLLGLATVQNGTKICENDYKIAQKLPLWLKKKVTFVMFLSQLQ